MERLGIGRGAACLEVGGGRGSTTRWLAERSGLRQDVRTDVFPERSLWAARLDAWHRTFPSGSLSRGRSLLKQIHQLGLIDIGADAELDIVQSGTPLAELYQLSMAAIAPRAVEAGALTADQASALAAPPTRPDFSPARSSTSARGVAARRRRRRMPA